MELEGVNHRGHREGWRPVESGEKLILIVIMIKILRNLSISPKFLIPNS